MNWADMSVDSVDSVDTTPIKVWVGGFGYDASKDDLAMFFAADYGRVTEVKVIKPKNQAPYAFIEFLTEDFNKNIYTDQITMNGNLLRIGQPSFHQKNSLWIGGLPFDVAEEEVAIFFKQVDVDLVKICRREGLRPFALVTLWDADDLQKFVNMPCAIRGEPLVIRLYDKHPKKSDRGSNPSVQDYIESRTQQYQNQTYQMQLGFNVKVHNLPKDTRYYHKQFKSNIDYFSPGSLKYQVDDAKTNPPTCVATINYDNKNSADQLVHYLNGSRLADQGLHIFAFVEQ